jgi:hypothetical protein
LRGARRDALPISPPPATPSLAIYVAATPMPFVIYRPVSLRLRRRRRHAAIFDAAFIFFAPPAAIDDAVIFCSFDAAERHSANTLPLRRTQRRAARHDF